MTEFYGKTLGEAIAKSIQKEKLNKQGNSFSLEQKKRFVIFAPEKRWSGWKAVWGKLAFVDPIKETQQWVIEISLLPRLDFYIPIKIQIKGGDKFYEGRDGGPHRVTVTGNVTTGIKIRLQSDVGTQKVAVTVRAVKTRF